MKLNLPYLVVVDSECIFVSCKISSTPLILGADVYMPPNQPVSSVLLLQLYCLAVEEVVSSCTNNMELSEWETSINPPILIGLALVG